MNGGWEDRDKMRQQPKQLEGQQIDVSWVVEALVPACVCSPEFFFLGSCGTRPALYCIGSLKYMLLNVIIKVHLKFGWKGTLGIKSHSHVFCAK